ncbi:sensor domain-containing diguanylate cyclase [Nocardia sp. NBC_01329]|uniref:sensor domain-containing diguanylate cyclase n=1 Tax=Nocardia sp. NBC_01329 TaxID=2903594 RepID=UPI002E148AEE|nr:sensor domain-containing diguanylate cyclase [Nocardia sp. NBC_01329]
MTVRELAVAWAEALDGTVAPTLTRDRIEDLLTEWAALLVDALRGLREPAIARAAATALADANYRDPQVVGRTVTLICGTMVEHLRRAEPGHTAVHDRAISVAAEFATGYTAALRSVALAEQEATLAAALAAAQEAERRRELSEARFAAVFAGASVGIGTVDTDGRVLEANIAFAEMLGLDVGEMPGRPVIDLVGPDNIGTAYARMTQLFAGSIDRFRLEIDYRRPDASTTGIDLSMSAVRDHLGRIRFLIGVAVDVTDRRKLARRLWHDANHDELTGLPNRAYFFDRLAAATPPVGVAYLDLDGFKEVNDRWGHSVGDEVLRTVGVRLHGIVTAAGGVVARLGGDEFIAMIERCSGTEQLAAMRADLLATLTAPMAIRQQTITIGTSIGTVYLDEAPTAIDEAMQAADIAMYRNKASRSRS